MTIAFAMISCDTGGGTEDKGKVTSVTVAAPSAYVELSKTLQFTETVVTTKASVAKTVTWSVAGAEGAGTGIVNGLLTVDTNESATSLTVRATSTFDKSKFDEATVEVVALGTKIIESFTVTTPDDTDLAPQNGTLKFSVAITGLNIVAGTDDAVTWEVTANTGFTLASGTEIDEDTGLLTVAAAQQLNSKLTVKATTTLADTRNTGKNASKEVEVVNFITLSFFDFKGGTVFKTMRLPAEMSISDYGRSLAKPPNRGADFAFKQWVTDDDEVVTTNFAAFANTNIYGEWYDGVFKGNTDRAEKVYLEDQAFVVYEFDLSPVFATGDNAAQKKAKAIAAVQGATALEASYGLSEAAIEVGGGGARARVLGPYYFNNDPDKKITLTSATGGNYVGDNFWGDFKSDPNGKPTIRLDGTGSALDTFNKWHAYMVYTSANSEWAGFTTFTKDEWKDVVYTFDPDPDATPAFGSSKYGNTMAYYDEIYVDGTFNGVKILDFDSTDFTKVYFATGVARSGAGSVVNTTNSIWNSGRVQMIRDVKLVLSDGTKITGTTPNLTIPAHTNKDKDGGDVAIPATTAAFATQVFAGYINPVIGSWRGGVNDTVAPSNAPGWTAPPQLPDALDHYIITLTAADIKLYGGNLAETAKFSKDANGVVSVAIDTTDINPKSWGITFDLPTELLTTWGYDAIWVEYDADIDSSSGDRAQFAAKSGRGTFSPNLTVGSSAWPKIEDGEGQKFIIAGGANFGTPAGISFQVNNNNTDNVPQKYTIKFTRIVLRAP